MPRGRVSTTEFTADELIEKLQRKAMAAPEPGEFHPNDVLNRDVEDMAVPIIADHLTSAGYTYIYNRRTGERSITNRNMLLAQLKKTDDEGRFFFDVTPPTDVTPIERRFHCYLHPDRPERASYDALGLATCSKANLTSPYQVNRHMKIRHPAEWATIEEERQRREREEDRSLQREFMATRAEKTA